MKILLREALHYAQFAWGLRAANRYPLHPDMDMVLREQLRNRENRFVEMLRRIVFATAAHPFRQMLDEARCGLGDIESTIAKKGLESTLDLLRKAGVYVTHDEFKARQPIVRGGKHIPAESEDFLNPLAGGAWQTQTSGSTGKRTSVPVNLAHAAHRECYHALALRQFGIEDRRWLSMSAILPSPFGITRPIWNKKSGFRIHRWYAVPGNRPESRYYRAATRILLTELRLLGVPAPPLTFLPQNDFTMVAREIDALRARGEPSFVTGSASSCVRVAAAALENALDISGARFWTTGEGLSPAKAEVISRAGAESYAAYWAVELGSVGFGCPHYEGENTVHHFQDATAIVTAPRTAPAAGAEVNAMYFTTLLPAAPFFAINLELGDHGVLRPAQCGCRFSKLGFDTVISGIYSYSKLTGHGATLIGTDIVRILEEALPARFGGSPSDYQLVEREVGAQTRFILRVNPRIGNVPAAEVEQCFLDEVKKLFGGSLTASLWSHAGAVQVIAQPPLAGRTGKVLPLHVLGRGTEAPVKAESAHAP